MFNRSNPTNCDPNPKSPTLYMLHYCEVSRIAAINTYRNGLIVNTYLCKFQVSKLRAQQWFAAYVRTMNQNEALVTKLLNC